MVAAVIGSAALGFLRAVAPLVDTRRARTFLQGATDLPADGAGDDRPRRAAGAVAAGAPAAGLLKIDGAGFPAPGRALFALMCFFPAAIGSGRAGPCDLRGALAGRAAGDRAAAGALGRDRVWP